MYVRSYTAIIESFGDTWTESILSAWASYFDRANILLRVIGGQNHCDNIRFRDAGRRYRSDAGGFVRSKMCANV
jgi:hypothetical protein